MRRRHGLTGVACALAAALGAPLAASPAFWQVATQADFLRGEVEQLSIDQHGRLVLGPALDRVLDTGTPFVWALLPGPDGSYYLGTGHDGRVFHVDRSGRSRLFYDAPEMGVHALAPAPAGGLYVATAPDGRIYRVSPTGEAVSFFDPEDKYIWALAVDARGDLYAATGERARIYRIAPDGTGAVFHESAATHVVALAFDESGRLLAGTDSPGRVFRFDANGRPFLLVDTTFQEVRGLRVDGQGRIYAVALSAREARAAAPGVDSPSAEAPRTPVPSVSAEITAVAVVDSVQAAAAPPAADRRPAGAIFRITPDGLWDQIWESAEDAPYDLAVEDGGTLLVATGPRGKIFRLEGDPARPTLLTRAPAQQVTRLHRAGERTLVASANPGLLLALAARPATRGTYESEVKDAGMLASWGTISWRAVTPAGTAVEISTRSGNTRTPDEAWSEWSQPYADPGGSRITSPSARYLQWRAVLIGGPASPVLTSLSAAYLQRNVRPRVVSITVHPPGVVFQKPFSTGDPEIAGLDAQPPDPLTAAQSTPGAPALGRRVYQKGLQTFVWKAEDENGDALVYDILYRREGDVEWKPLASGLTDTIYVWDTSSVPNGTYVVRIVASDSPSHPPALALRGERESESFDIDNTPPVLVFGPARRQGERLVVPFEVRDQDSVLRRVEYSVDARRWQPIFPIDGILDARHERFELDLDAALAGRTLVVRATDAMNNVGTGQIVLR